MWWADPTDQTALGVEDEWLVGEAVLVAPVLQAGATSRDVFLPRGVWRDGNRPDSEPQAGPAWVRDYSADLFTLPYFVAV